MPVSSATSVSPITFAAVTGLLLHFNAGGAVFDLENVVTGFDCAAQNALVCIGTNAGSDQVYPSKGTSLYKAATNGALIDLATAQEASNYAAVDTLFFSRQNEMPGVSEVMQSITLTPTTYNGISMVVNATFLSSAGNSVGFNGTPIT